MKKRYPILAIALTVAAVLATAAIAYYKSLFPYGESHCCILGMSSVLEAYAAEHKGYYPAGQSSPEASLSLLYRSNYIDAYTLRGMTIPEKTVRAVFDAGGLLGPDTCGWHYTAGLTVADDPQIALLYCKQPLGHNGQTTKDGGRQVVFVGGNVEWVSGKKWASFLAGQKDLLSKRSERAKSGAPLVNATIELPDGRLVENIEAPYILQEQGSGASGTTSGNSLHRDSLVWFRAPLEENTFSGFITRTLWFSNLVSAPVVVAFTNGVPDKINAVFKMHNRW